VTEEPAVLRETGQVRVRPAVRADLGAVAGILAFYVTDSVVTFEEDPPGLPDWHQRLDGLAERGLPFVVAEADGVVAGYAYASPWRPKPAYRHTVEDSVYLAPGQRGRGLGRRLLESVLAGCADAGVRQVIAVIADSGDPASVALHRACGFADAGRLAQVGYKHGRWVDTVLMQREVKPRVRA
jgi:L-amino acid N-acyltransferase YncA